jgi:hypothetical protein
MHAALVEPDASNDREGDDNIPPRKSRRELEQIQAAKAQETMACLTELEAATRDPPLEVQLSKQEIAHAMYEAGLLPALLDCIAVTAAPAVRNIAAGVHRGQQCLCLDESVSGTSSMNLHRNLGDRGWHVPATGCRNMQPLQTLDVIYIIL